MSRFQLKKTDWIALALTGVILLVIALPLDSGKDSKNAASTANLVVDSAISQNSKETETEKYVENLEKRLEEVLGKMEGVGKVEVMLTLSDYGESVVEKDVKTSVDKETQSETIYVEDDAGSYPYVEKEILPTVEGVVVVAEGGGNATVASNISNTAMALFGVEAHKIIVVKMSSKGD